MAFFDLSIPYVDKAGGPASDTRSRRDSRLRTVARAMELGYTAVAYDRSFRGVLSDADRCQIVPFPAQSFLENVSGDSLAAFTAAVSLHRDLLGVPRTSPFRQYTRITVSVDSAAAASALNSGNRLLRSYDLVAARPVNQMAFDQACKASEVDIISLDFSQKLPFRLKLAMVQAAIKRGVHFEISYSHLIADGHARRQILSEAKMLGEWTRGKNLIISGSATSLNDVRGPHDVANLSTILLGLSMERAKAAISKNCRSLVANALRKKDCYFKEAIKIERILPEENMVSQGNWFKDWNDWEPISSGVNDLPSLDDMAKLFSAASASSKSLNAVDFTSVNGMAPNVPLFSCANSKIEPDSSDGHRPSNIDRVLMESVPNAADEERNPCSDENSMDIDHFQNPSCNRTPMFDVHLPLTSLVEADIYGTRDQPPCKETILTVEEHHLAEMGEIKKFSSSGDGHLSGSPDMMEVHEQLSLEYSTSKDLDEAVGQEQSTLQFKTSISEDFVNLLDGCTEMEMKEMQLHTSNLCKRNVFYGFGTKTEGNRPLSTAEIPEAGVLPEDPSPATEEEPCFLPENSTTLESAVIEMKGEGIKQSVTTGGFSNRRLRTSGKRRRSHHPGFRLSVKNFCKPMFFKKKTGRLRRRNML